MEESQEKIKERRGEMGWEERKIRIKGHKEGEEAEKKKKVTYGLCFIFYDMISL